MLDELNRYTDENKRKFDIVAAMGMAELADEELGGIVAKQVEDISSEFEDFGYYYDERGIKKWGIIPKSKSNIPKYNLYEYHDYGGIRSSNPRYHSGYLL